MSFFYPPTLPISNSLDQLRELVTRHQVVVVAGETGSGKTTQLPKLCLELFYESKGMIGCTQPRRIAATSVADRVAEELGEDGRVVGSKVRFQDRTSKGTRIKFMTDGVLLAETKQDPLLKNYKVIIIDEAHERNLNIDFLLGYLHTILNKRSDLRLIITSATIDTEAFSAHFKNAPTAVIEGRAYPVEVTYSPLPENEDELTYLEHCIEEIVEVCTTRPPGDLLVFLPTEKDIRTCCEILKGRLDSHCVLPLFGRLQAKDQKLIFQSHKLPKIVVATNVAETSVTVPGIRYVIDSGLARIGTYHPRSRTMRLPIDRISQASCNQRAGRSGRIGPGVCIRLFSEDDYLSREPFSVPEIQRSNLAEVILQMVVLNLGDPHHFPFLDPPRKASIHEGFRTLQELGAIDGKNRITSYGKIMSSMPIDPVISRIILEANKYGCLTEIIIIAAALAIQDPKIRPAEKTQEADAAHRRFADQNSDFVALLKIWKEYHRDNRGFSWSGLRRFCKQHYLSFQRMREWLDLHEQLQRLTGRNRKFTFNQDPATYEQIHRSLLAGLFRQSGRKKKGAAYQGLGNRELHIFPGSHLYPKGGDWIIGGSFIETSRLFVLTAANIEAEWLERSAKNFCSYSWSNIRYQKKTGRIMADETVALHGLVIASARPVNYPRRDDKNVPAAREIFIREALVANNLSGRFDFYSKNVSLIRKWQASEHKLRKKDIVIDDEAIFAFYDRRLPPQVYDRPSLIRYSKRHGDNELRMTQADILLRVPDKSDLLDFPPSLPDPHQQIKLVYNFDPGADDDGVTALIPEDRVDTLDPDLFDWLVPGLIVEKTAFLIKGLPKRLRKQLIPVNNAVALLLDSMEMYRGNFLRKLAAAILNRYKITVRLEDWPQDLPRHLFMHYRVVNSSGKAVMKGSDYRALLNETSALSEGAPRTISEQDQLLIDGLQGKIFTTWEFDSFPARIAVHGPGTRVSGYLYGGIQPSPENKGVHFNYFPSREEADNSGRRGLYYLIRLQFKPQFSQLEKYCHTSFSGPSAVWLTAYVKGTAKTCDTILDFVTKTLLEANEGPIVSGADFQSQVDQIRQLNLYDYGKRIIDRILLVLRHRRETAELITRHEHLSKQSKSLNDDLFADLRHQLEQIIPAGFLDNFTLTNLEDCTRYLKSLAIRCERAYHNPQKDLEKRKKLLHHQQNVERYWNKLPELGRECRLKIEDYAKMLEEFRISLFSPEMKTTIPVSEKKLTQAWKEISSMC